jgi:15-cis-phytoene synthase
MYTLTLRDSTSYPQLWEHTLLPLAYEAEHRPLAPTSSPASDRTLLARAYTYCDRMTSMHSRTFFLATRLLPPEKKRALRALYAFCRKSDDLVDCLQENAQEMLAAWYQEALAPAPPPDDLI